MAGFSIKSYLPRSLFGRSLLILIIPVFLIQVITAIVFFDRHWEKMTTRLAFAVAGEIAVITHLIQSADGIADIEEIQSHQGRHLGLDVQVLESGDLPEAQSLFVVAPWRNIVVQKLHGELSGQIKEDFTLNFNFEDKMIAVFVALGGDRILKIEFPQRRLFSSSGYVFLLWVLGVSTLLLIVAVLFMRNQIRPIRKLAVAAERFGKGRDVPSFKPEGAREVRQAALAFLDMRRRIQRQISQRTDMLAGVSHDLRTPLTRLKLELEMLSERHDVEAMKSDVHEMEKMIAGYLDFVRGDGEETFESIELDVLFSKIFQALERQGLKITSDIESGLRVRVRVLSFERALNNLLTNAGKYGEHIWVKVFVDDKKLQIQIEDDGPGIPEEQYDEVFKPFTRVDTSRNAETGGVGLGLPIAMDIVHAHGGNITLTKSEHGGLCVKVRMPV